MKTDTIQEIIELAQKFDLAELEIEEKNQRVRLKRYPEGTSEVVTSSQPKAISQADSPAKSAPTEPEEDKNAVYIKSPMVGTFYRSPSPESDPFVKSGSRVESSTVVCIIEAMKVMNEIQAEIPGKIVDVLVENGESVDFGRPLFRIEST